MKLLFVLLLAFSSLAHADPRDWVATAAPIVEELANHGPVEVALVEAQTTSPVFVGYFPKSRLCSLFINTAAAEASTELVRLVAIVHETGHCHALWIGFTQIGGPPTRSDEAFADVYAIAWFSANRPLLLNDAYAYLIKTRALNRLDDPSYNTLMAIHRSRQLVNGGDPLAFTLQFMAP